MILEFGGKKTFSKEAFNDVFDLVNRIDQVLLACKEDGTSSIVVHCLPSPILEGQYLLNAEGQYLLNALSRSWPDKALYPTESLHNVGSNQPQTEEMLVSIWMHVQTDSSADDNGKW